MALLRVQNVATGRLGAEAGAAAMTYDRGSGDEVARSNGGVLAGDSEIAAVLRSPDLGATSLEWIQVREAFIELAFPQLVAMGTTARLHDAARRRRARGLRAIPKDLALDEACARALAHQMIARALRSFRGTALPRWDPAKGASLATYFLGCCELQLATAWNALWPTSDDTTPREEVLTPPSELPDVGVAEDWGLDPAETVPSRIVMRSFLGRLRSTDPTAAQLFELKARGYSLTEAVQRLGEGPALKSRVWRMRRRLEREEDF